MVSPGCTNCYAMRMAARLQAMEHPAYTAVTRKSGGRPVWTGRLHLNRAALEIPLRWRSPRRVFVNSMSDLFQDGVPGEFIRDVWHVMGQAHWHTFQILTKRPDNMLAVMKEQRLPVLSNVWLGASVESADYRGRIGTARPMNPGWVSEIQSACERFGTAFFFKQWGGANKKKAGRLLKGRTWDEYPAAPAPGE